MLPECLVAGPQGFGIHGSRGHRAAKQDAFRHRLEPASHPDVRLAQERHLAWELRIRPHPFLEKRHDIHLGQPLEAGIVEGTRHVFHVGRLARQPQVEPARGGSRLPSRKLQVTVHRAVGHKPLPVAQRLHHRAGVFVQGAGGPGIGFPEIEATGRHRCRHQ